MANQIHQRLPAHTSAYDEISKYYHIHDKKLGEGGFAKVRLATHLATRQYVAIKCLDKVKLGAELPRIYNEIDCLKRLKHENIARLYQVFETDNLIYLVLEYCAGGELFDYIVSKSKLEERESAQIMHDLMRVLDFIHINGFAHRDLKPENILFDDKHQIKLIDFGLAANCSAGSKQTNFHNANSLDQLSTCCGSVTYAAPEVISGKLYSGTAVDVWSAGVILYALLVGQLPFNDNNIPKLYQKIQGGIKNLPSFLSPEACDLIHKMLTIDPCKRITVREVLFHPWLRHKANALARIHRRLDYGRSLIDEQLVTRCCEKFPQMNPIQLRDYIQKDFNYYAATYHLMLNKCPPQRSTPVKRAIDGSIATGDQVARPQVTPTKKTRFVTVMNSPRPPRTPPSYLRHLRAHTADGASEGADQPTPLKSINAPQQLHMQQLQQQTPQQRQRSTENSNRASVIFGQTPKKSIVKRILESATPSKLKQPRKMLMRQNDIMNVTLTRFKDPNSCLNHFQAAMERKGFQCKRKDFSLKCFNQSIRLTLEVCTYNNQCAIQRKRIKGDSWQYKLVCEEILRISNTSNDRNASCVVDSKPAALLSPANREGDERTVNRTNTVATSVRI